MGHLLRQKYGRAGLTLEMNLQYLRALRQGSARCEAGFTQRGRSIAFLQSKLFDTEGQLAVSASSTWKVPSADADLR
jgi:acyl-coenzyme A thioesterase PaaI-like protein